MKRELSEKLDSILDVHREEVRRLRNRIDEREAGAAVAMRPVSRERLRVQVPGGTAGTATMLYGDGLRQLRSVTTE